MSVKICKSREENSMLSSLHLLDDNKNKFNLINKIDSYADSLKTNPNPTVKKSEVLLFLSHVNKSIKISHELIRNNLPYGAKTYHDAMSRVNQTNHDESGDKENNSNYKKSIVAMKNVMKDMDNIIQKKSILK